MTRRMLLVCLLLLGVSWASGGCSSGSTGAAAPQDPNALIAEALRIADRAERARRSGDDRRAMELYRESIAVYDGLAVPHNNLGMLLMARGEALSASRSFRRAADLAPSDPRPLANLGFLHGERGWTSDALRYYELALERDPNDVESLRGVIRSAESEGRADRDDLEYIRRATFIEKDARWLGYIERQRYRVENQIRLRAERERGSG